MHWALAPMKKMSLNLIKLPKEVIMKDVIEMLQELSDKGFIEE